MAGELDRMTPEFALVSALESVSMLSGKVAALQPKKDWKAPFAFYQPTTDDEERALDGDTGLQSWTATVHLVHPTFRGLQVLCAYAKTAIRALRGTEKSTPEYDPASEGLRGTILIEDAEATQTSPDLFESEVGVYRRMYTVRIDFQTESVSDIDTEEVNTDDDLSERGNRGRRVGMALPTV